MLPTTDGFEAPAADAADAPAPAHPVELSKPGAGGPTGPTGPSGANPTGPSGPSDPSGPGGPGPAARPPSNLARGIALTVGAVLTLAFVGYACLALVALAAQQKKTFTSSFPAAAVKAVDVDVSDAAVTLVGDAAPDGRVTMSSTVHYSWSKPTYTATIDASGTLRVRLSCTTWAPISCTPSPELAMHIPRGAQVTVHSGDGAVHARGLTGALNLTTSDGGITLSDVSGDLALTTSDGSIRADDDVTSAHVTANTSDGAVTLAFDRPPTAVTAHTGDGGVTIHLPDRSGPYHLTTSTGDGSVHAGSVRSDPTAERAITARTGDGGIRIDYQAG
jgi:hypothetical protein